MPTLSPRRQPSGSGKRTSLLIAGLLLSIAFSPVWSATLEVVASEPMVQPGEMVDISVVISGLGNFALPSLGTFDMMLTYDPAVFALDAGSTAVALFLGDEVVGEALVTITPSAGVIEVVELSLLAVPDLTALQPASFTLFSSTFTAVGFGEGTFDLAVTVLGDKNGVTIPVDGITPVEVGAGTLLSIPTVGQSGLALLALLLLVLGVFQVRRIS